MNTHTKTSPKITKSLKDAATRYNAQMAIALARIADLQLILEAHQKETDGAPHWGHVGDMAHVAEKLTELTAFFAK